MSYTFRHEPKNAPKVTHVEVPKEFATALNEQWKIVQRDQVNPVIDFASAKEAAFHLAYAKEWARTLGEGKVVTVRKGTVRQGDQEGTLRLLMEPYNPNAPKRGRKSNAEKLAATA